MEQPIYTEQEVALMRAIDKLTEARLLLKQVDRSLMASCDELLGDCRAERRSQRQIKESVQ